MLFYLFSAVTTPAPAPKNEQTNPPLVQTIIDEKEQLLTEKKSGNNALFSDLKKKLIENLKKLAPDLGLSLGNTTRSQESTVEVESTDKNASKNIVNPIQAVTEVRYEPTKAGRRKTGRKENLGDLKELLKDPDGTLLYSSVRNNRKFDSAFKMIGFKLFQVTYFLLKTHTEFTVFKLSYTCCLLKNLQEYC